MTVLDGNTGQVYRVHKLEGTTKIKDYLQTLGFFSGSSLTIISKSKSSFVLSVKDGRYAIDRKLASQIFLKEDKPCD